MLDECELIAEGDFDADGDVDLDDFTALAEAVAGPNVPPDPSDPACVDVCLDAFDTEPDGDLDLWDFAAFQRASTEPRLPAPEMVVVHAGEFEMGDPFGEGWYDEFPVHSVTLGTYTIDKYEVTNAHYAAALNWACAQGDLIHVSDGIVYQAGGTEYPYCTTYPTDETVRIQWSGNGFSVLPGKNNHPAVVNWYGAVAYCNWRSALEGKPLCYDLSTWTCDFGTLGYRLPTEAEWEKAAAWDPVQQRHFRFSEHTDGRGADCLDGQRANYSVSGDPFDLPPWPTTTPVGFYNGELHFKTAFDWPGSAESYQTQEAKSYYGCSDLSGYEQEWCNDRYDETYYSYSPEVNPQGPSSGTLRIVRGGLWGTSPDDCRSACRLWNGPAGWAGFRCALGTP